MSTAPLYEAPTGLVDRRLSSERHVSRPDLDVLRAWEASGQVLTSLAFAAGRPVLGLWPHLA